jgi:hypothetical protein
MRERLVTPRDVAWILVLMALALAPRLYWASGIGLSDDFIFRGEVNAVLNKQVLPDNQAYRFSWWFPTALSCRIFGLTELGLILPFTVTATLAVGLLYLFGKTLWGRPGGIIAALLLAAYPLDFAWSTMVTNDIVLSFYSALTMLLVLRALAHDDPAWRRRLWALAGVTLWLAYHAKISALLVIPAVAVACLANRRRLDRRALWFLATAIPLFAFSSLFLYVLTGDPLFHYHAELEFQGLAGPLAKAHAISPDVFWYYPRLLFFPDSLGDLVHSVYPHALLLLAAVGTVLGLRSSGVVLGWLIIVFLGMQLTVVPADGVWISGFRNIRHLHVVVYPLVLALTGYLVALRTRSPLSSAVLLAALLAFSGWQCVATAQKTQIAFADRRTVCRYLLELPPKPSYADQGIVIWCTVLDPTNGPPKVKELPADVLSRKAQIATITSGYVVTGGAREPYYGCPSCITSASELPAGRWRLVQKFPDLVPPVPWRQEALRVWEAIEPPAARGG